jgi:hypothetical protein
MISCLVKAPSRGESKMKSYLTPKVFTLISSLTNWTTLRIKHEIPMVKGNSLTSQCH